MSLTPQPIRIAARPSTLLGLTALVYFLLYGRVAGSLAAQTRWMNTEALAIWATIGVFSGGLAVIVSYLSVTSQERAVFGKALSGRFVWIGFSAIFVLFAHWVLWLAWSPIALFLSFTSSGHRAEEYLWSGAAGLAVWVVLGVAAGALLWVRRAHEARSVADTSSLLIGPRIPGLVCSVLLMIGIEGPVACVSVLAIQGDAEFLWLVLGLFGVGLLFSAGLGWTGAAVATLKAARLGRTTTWLEHFWAHFGVSSAALWSVVFVVGLFPVWGDALKDQFFLLMLCVVMVSVGVGLLGMRLSTLEKRTAIG